MITSETPVIDLTTTIKQEDAPLTFEKIDIQFEEADRGEEFLEDAQGVLMDLLKLREAQAAVDTLIKKMYSEYRTSVKTRRAYERTPHFDIMEAIGTDEIDTAQKTLLDEIDREIMRYRDYCDRAESEIEDIREQDENDARFGSYADQVRSIR